MNKYKYLNDNFFKGAFGAQINSVYRDKDKKPDKVNEFKDALKAGDCKIEKKLTKLQFQRAGELGVKVPESLYPNK